MHNLLRIIMAIIRVENPSPKIRSTLAPRLLRACSAPGSFLARNNKLQINQENRTDSSGHQHNPPSHRAGKPKATEPPKPPSHRAIQPLSLKPPCLEPWAGLGGMHEAKTNCSKQKIMEQFEIRYNHMKLSNINNRFNGKDENVPAMGKTLFRYPVHNL